MSGIFSRMNHQGAAFGEVTLSPAFLDGVLLMQVAGIRTNPELIAAINAALVPGPPLDAEALSDVGDMIDHIADALGEGDKVPRIHRILSAAGIWETGLAGITEAEARTMTGVTFTFGE